ncbi:uncharacterized mitochondrial protein AtMg00810-like [Vicia villosa]|uniref:uncharacterized mitochondrial protein AtMg00810-like n=1 Tax=Vicia villosa TaxID=3911 RepID=UPI00273CF0A8|nr:uncharacterized mitochondrial protein AtMg00810-like [Vicia villosa]
MADEIQALTSNKTWIITTLPPGNDIQIINKTKQILHQHFHLKDLGPLKYFLGIEVARNTTSININQRKYTPDLLSSAGLLACKPAKTPMARDTRLSATKGITMTDPTKFRRLVGQLIYLLNTRPDIAYAVQQLSQHMQTPTDIHYEAALRVLRYRKNTPAQGIFFSSKQHLQIKAFSDSDWATCPDTRRSITGYCIYLGQSLVSWKSKKQPTVSRSSTEAEYRSMATTVCEIQWITNLLQELKIPLHTPANLYCDNASSRHIASNSSFHERTKDIDLDCHLVREKLQERLFHLLPVTSLQQLADVFTKPLDTTPFLDNLSKLGLHSIYS